jgi:chloramphenicol 3-O phosphotransferase
MENTVMRQKVILLNGASSSGKSTLADTLHKTILDKRNEEYGVISIDDFLAMTTDKTIYEDDVFEISSMLCKKAVELLRSKAGIIIDHVITSERIFQQITKALKYCDIYLIQVTCPLAELVRREIQRGNRNLGSAEASYQYLFPKETYDLTVDTFQLSVKECSLEIYEILKDKPKVVNVNQTTIIILRGNSGSGKTTVARALQKQFGQGTLLISQDVIRREMLWVKDGAETKAISLLCDLTRYGNENCDIVILEGILNANWYRELFEEIRNTFTSIFAYYYELPFDETIARHQTKASCNEFGETQMKSWWKEKDYIGIIEEKIITKEIGLDEAVNMIYDEVMNHSLGEDM